MISSKQLTFSDGHASAFISDFGHGFRFERIYTDACDIGVSVLSDKTGKIAKYAVERELTDSEGELTGWLLKATHETLRKIPQLAGKNLIIYND